MRKIAVAEEFNLAPTIEGEIVVQTKSGKVLWTGDISPMELSTINHSLMNGVDIVYTLKAERGKRNEHNA
jgi:hypothetical protein